ncbi:hypothetical protein [Streptomyces sp. ODS28]|uniref:hypothetical protein n=1 Tax=Streptomyces sp. ODS28 TaxID=3136688 RepID=UPI0031EA2503
MKITPEQRERMSINSIVRAMEDDHRLTVRRWYAMAANEHASEGARRKIREYIDALEALELPKGADEEGSADAA